MSECPTCNKYFTVTKKRKKFCSKNCNMSYRHNEHIKQIEQYGSFSINNSVSPNLRTIRKYLINKSDNICHICKLNADNWNDKPLTLIIDHINGDASDWTINNVRLICPNCDSQTSTYKGRNKGKSTRTYTITQKLKH